MHYLVSSENTFMVVQRWVTARKLPDVDWNIESSHLVYYVILWKFNS